MNILKAEDLDNENMIPFKSKQGLIVKKMANKLAKDPNCICKIGLLTKQGNKPNKKIEYRYLVLTARELLWYHNEKEYKDKKIPLGVVFLFAVYHCVPANRFLRTSDINVRKFFNVIDWHLSLEKERCRKRGKEGIHFWC